MASALREVLGRPQHLVSGAVFARHQRLISSSVTLLVLGPNTPIVVMPINIANAMNAAMASMPPECNR